MDKLIDAGGMFDAQHFLRDLVHVLGGDLETGLLVLEEGLYILNFRQGEKGIQLTFCIEEDIEGPDLLSAGGRKIGGVAFKHVGEVDAQPIDLAAAKGIHIVLGHQGPFSLLDPGQLDLFMAVQVGIEMGEDVFLDDDRLVARHGDGELQYFHHNGVRLRPVWRSSDFGRKIKLRHLRILALKY